MILLIEWAFRGRHIGLREVIGSGLAFVGVAIVALGSEGQGLSINPSDALMFLATGRLSLRRAARRRSEPDSAIPLTFIRQRVWLINVRK